LRIDIVQIGRGEFIRFGLGALGGASVRAVPLIAQSDERRARVARLIEEYDAQGVHRTATEVDHRSGRWLSDLVSGAGARVRLEAFKLNRVDIRAAYAEAENRRAEGLPLFDGTFTDAKGIVGRLAPPEFGLAVALVVLDSAGISSEGRALEGLRRSNKHRAIVAVTEGTNPGLTPTNAQAFATPYGIPVLQVEPEDHLWLRDLAARGVDIRVVADARERQPKRAMWWRPSPVASRIFPRWS
jgi:hypothetical protein